MHFQPAIADTQEILTINDSIQYNSFNFLSASESVSSVFNYTAIAGGVYAIWADQDVYILNRTLVGGTAVTILNGFLLFASNTLTIRVANGTYLAAIGATANGRLSIMPINNSL